MHPGCESFRQLGRRQFFRVGGAGLFGMTHGEPVSRPGQHQGGTGPTDDRHLAGRRPARTWTCST